jgi:putative salt-induced outer membrane protein
LRGNQPSLLLGSHRARFWRHYYIINGELWDMLKTCVCIVLLCCCCTALYAAQVTLKNGDRLTGTIVSLSDKKLTVKTDYAGDITIAWDAVAQFTSDQAMVVTRTDKQVVSGAVAAQDSSVVINSASGTQTIPQSDVAVIRSPADQAAYEKSLHPGFLEDWTGGGSFGFALARGNSDTTNVALGFNTDRKTTTDEWNLFIASLYTTSTTNNVTATTANSLGGAIRYDHNLTKRLFGFGLFSGMYDDLQDLNERLSPNGGLGFHVIASKKTTLDVLGGIGYTYENYSNGVVNNYVNANIGEALAHNFTTTTVVTEKLFFYPYLNDAGNYRGTFDFGLASKFYRALTWNLNFGDIYNSKPIAGKKDNDLVLTTGLGITFGAKPK